MLPSALDALQDMGRCDGWKGAATISQTSFVVKGMQKAFSVPLWSGSGRLALQQGGVILHVLFTMQAGSCLNVVT